MFDFLKPKTKMAPENLGLIIAQVLMDKFQNSLALKHSWLLNQEMWAGS